MRTPCLVCVVALVVACDSAGSMSAGNAGVDGGYAVGAAGSDAAASDAHGGAGGAAAGATSQDSGADGVAGAAGTDTGPACGAVTLPCCDGGACVAGLECRNGVCDCPADRALCDGQCVSLDSAGHCGACDHVCPVACSRGSCVHATGLAAGFNHTCALLSDGSAACWGRGIDGQLGDGTATTLRVSPTAVAGLANAISLSSAGDDTCALLAGGTLACWGVNLYGQLGDGTTTTRVAPIAVPGLSGVVSAAAGWNHTCAVLSDGSALCWGQNEYGQLGDGTKTTRFSPAPVLGLTSARTISAGLRHSCAVLDDDTVECWGDNSESQLRGIINDPLTFSTQPVAVGLAGVTRVWCGETESCALLSDATVKCWSYTGMFTVFSGVASFDVGNTGACAALLDGTVDCGSPWPQVKVAGATAIAVGGDHGCVIVAGGAVLCWGDNDYGQLGDGTTTTRGTPAPVVW